MISKEYRIQTEHSASLYSVYRHLFEDKETTVWYVDRRARIIRFEIRRKPSQQVFFDKSIFYVTAYDVLKDNKRFEYKKQIRANEFYMEYHRYGHFFLKHKHALVYMLNRIHSGNGNVVKKAEAYVESLPEVLI